MTEPNAILLCNFSTQYIDDHQCINACLEIFCFSKIVLRSYTVTTFYIGKGEIMAVDDVELNTISSLI